MKRIGQHNLPEDARAEFRGTTRHQRKLFKSQSPARKTNMTQVLHILYLARESLPLERKQSSQYSLQRDV
jgi:hypothetical protein